MTTDEKSRSLWCERMNGLFRRSYGGGIAAFATPDSVHYQPDGVLSTLGRRPPDEHTLFEIGSITKVFTALLLARLSIEGRIDPAAPITDLFPELAGLPAWVTPRALSTHSAGLPRIPVGMTDRAFWNKHDPYAAFGEQRLLEWVQDYRPKGPPKPGAFQYSNLGVGLLGYVLGRVAGSDYKTALRELVLRPLGLDGMGFELSSDQAARLAPPHKSWGRPTPPWAFDALAGAGALRASAADLVAFGRAVLTASKGADGIMAAAIRETLEVQIAGKKSFMPSRCLGWLHIRERQTGVAVFHHDGGTAGSSSSLFVCPDAGFLLFALANRPTTLRTAWRQVRLDINGLLHEMISTAKD